jgi:hypothetical protein
VNIVDCQRKNPKHAVIALRDSAEDARSKRMDGLDGTELIA